jgi:hypothetical protein
MQRARDQTAQLRFQMCHRRGERGFSGARGGLPARPRRFESLRLAGGRLCRPKFRLGRRLTEGSSVGWCQGLFRCAFRATAASTPPAASALSARCRNVRLLRGRRRHLGWRGGRDCRRWR